MIKIILMVCMSIIFQNSSDFMETLYLNKDETPVCLQIAVGHITTIALLHFDQFCWFNQMRRREYLATANNGRSDPKPNIDRMRAGHWL
jgi:hypothetical protein